MHAEAFAFVALAARDHRATGPVYEIGSLNINGTVRGLFPSAGLYLGIDVVPGPCVDLVADGATYLPPVEPSTVVCCEVLEHTEAAPVIVAQAAKVLAPGGLLIITCAGDGRAPHSAVDGGPLRSWEFYRNIPADELRAWAVDAGITPLPMTPPYPGDAYFVGRKP
jgi:hypothetical protein